MKSDDYVWALSVSLFFAVLMGLEGLVYRYQTQAHIQTLEKYKLVEMMGRWPYETKKPSK